jgi:hypothetical protein
MFLTGYQALFGLEAKPGGRSPRLRMLVPAYFYPAGTGLKHWQNLIKAAARVPVLAIVNPDSGPGSKPDQNYIQIIGKAKKAGITLLCYVDTNYTKRPLADVKKDMERWIKFYPRLHGFFFDQQASDADKATYYAALYKYAGQKVPKALVVTNPGTACAPEFLSRPAADLINLFENVKGFDEFELPAWAKKHPAQRFAALVSATDSAKQMQRRIRTAVTKGLGVIFVTDGKLPNPWDHLPSYWEAEVKAIAQVNKVAAPK